MPRISRTPYAILGALSIEPMSGYDIKAFLDSTVGHFWRESFGQLYPQLDRLRNGGLVSREGRAGKGARPRHVYSITERGRAELRRWLTEEAEPDIGRREGLLKLFFGSEVGAEISASHVEEYRRRAAASLAHLARAEEQLRSEDQEDPRFPYWSITLQFGQAIARAIVDWADEALAQLAASDDATDLRREARPPKGEVADDSSRQPRQ